MICLLLFVSVFKLNDESVSDEASATFITLSQPLEVKVPQYIQSLPTATVILDASRSSDPDNAPENPKFFWACAKVIEIKKDTANSIYISTDGFKSKELAEGLLIRPVSTALALSNFSTLILSHIM